VSTASPSADELVAPAGHATRAAVVMRIAGKPGPTFVLTPHRDNVLGRSGDIDIALADRLASRRHAAIRFDGTHWLVEDLDSRNGTWLDGRSVQTASLLDGSVVRIGMTELAFQILNDVAPPQDASSRSVIRSGPVGQLQGDAIRRSQTVESEESRRGVLLYQASLRLLAARSSQEVICAMLELVIEHTAASCVGWFRISSASALEPVCVVPPGGQLTWALATPVFRSMIETRVSGEGHAVWLRPNPAVGVHSEIVCIPLLDGSTAHAVVVAMAPSGRLQDPDFDLLVGLATLATAAWDGHSGSSRRQPDGNRHARSSGPAEATRGESDQDLAGMSTVELDPVRESQSGMR
jgi:pSer/pThr/pTyr-binding forkhead associated (FHA) protein